VTLTSHLHCRSEQGTSGFWLVNPKDLAFEAHLVEPAADFEVLSGAVSREIQAGRFGRALKLGGPVSFQTFPPAATQRGVFHPMALSSQVVGMFCGLLKDAQRLVPEIAFSLLSLVLSQTADALATLRKTRQMADQIATLSGLLPVCAWCKRVRDDRGYWEQIDRFLASRSTASVTHGICPDCLRRMSDGLPNQLSSVK
jgi:hypothetical protein